MTLLSAMHATRLTQQAHMRGPSRRDSRSTEEESSRSPSSSRDAVGPGSRAGNSVPSSSTNMTGPRPMLRLQAQIATIKPELGTARGLMGLPSAVSRASQRLHDHSEEEEEEEEIKLSPKGAENGGIPHLPPNLHPVAGYGRVHYIDPEQVSDGRLRFGGGRASEGGQAGRIPATRWPSHLWHRTLGIAEGFLAPRQAKKSYHTHARTAQPI
ncbi:hypothetical protein F4780DRAFT_704146 [Xylariomycetidae sp. FL0641]|nr:hypothetical protein F4780DRAFT_704146 [Xylariomycetidae sp. FL0641]